MTDKTTPTKVTTKVEGRASHFTHTHKFLLELQEKILEGWRVDITERGIRNGAVLTRSKARVTLSKEVIPEEVQVVSVDAPTETKTQKVTEEVAELTDEQKVKNIEEGILAAGKFKKEEMIWFASQKGIEIPKELTNPLQIRKHIKENLES